MRLIGLAKQIEYDSTVSIKDRTHVSGIGAGREDTKFYGWDSTSGNSRIISRWYVLPTYYGQVIIVEYRMVSTSPHKRSNPRFVCTYCRVRTGLNCRSRRQTQDAIFGRHDPLRSTLVTLTCNLHSIPLLYNVVFKAHYLS